VVRCRSARFVVKRGEIHETIGCGVAVFAVTPGSKVAPIQVLVPSDPPEQTPLRGGRSYVIRPLSGRGLMHLAEAGSAPVLVAFV